MSAKATNWVEQTIKPFWDAGESILRLFPQNRVKQQLNEFFINRGLIKYEGNVIKSIPKIEKVFKTNYGFHIVIKLFPGLSIEDIFKGGNGFALEFALGGELKAYKDNDYYVHIKVYTKDIPKYFKYVPKLSERIKKYPLAIPAGISRQGLVLIRLYKDDEFAVLLGGMPGSGKSAFLCQAIQAIVDNYSSNEVNLHIIDMKAGVELFRFNKYPHVVNYSENLTDTKMVLINVIKEINQRANLFKDKKVSNITEYNKLSNNKLPHSILVIDEFMDFTIEEATLLFEIIRKGRFAGIHPIVSTQYPSHDKLPIQIRNLFPVTICFKTINKNGSRLLLGDDNTMAIYIKEQGRAILNKNGYLRQIQVMYLPTEGGQKPATP